jgi:hypothetical protein
MSASFNASALTVAPTAANSESGRPDLVPAPIADDDVALDRGAGGADDDDFVGH